MIALLVLADGREEYLAQTIASARVNLAGPISERWLYAETGDDAYRARLAEAYPEFIRIGEPGPKRGFSGAIQDAWRIMRERSAAEYVLHLEQDFTFNRPLDLSGPAEILADHWYLAQLALRRQPWNPQEAAAGGIVEQHPDAYVDCALADHEWLEQRLFFTTNPSLYRRSLCTVAWPDPPHSEGMFTHRLLADGTPEAEPGSVRFGYWGPRASTPWVHHIGHVRAGTGY